MSSLIFILGALRAIVEVAGLCLLGQGILHHLAGSAREGNAIYKLFRLVASPAVSVVRRLGGHKLAPGRLSLLTFCLLFCLWLLLAYVRQQLLSGAF